MHATRPDAIVSKSNFSRSLATPPSRGCHNAAAGDGPEASLHNPGGLSTNACSSSGHDVFVAELNRFRSGLVTSYNDT